VSRDFLPPVFFHKTASTELLMTALLDSNVFRKLTCRVIIEGFLGSPMSNDCILMFKIMANICVPLLHRKNAPEPVISGMINIIGTASLEVYDKEPVTFPACSIHWKDCSFGLCVP
jgi:hypothetical protein